MEKHVSELSELSREYVSPSELVSILRLSGITTGTLATWRHLGGGPPYRKLGRFVYYVLDEVDEWLKSAARKGTHRV